MGLPFMLFPLPKLSWMAMNIVRRQGLVSRKLWKGGLGFVILEPLIMLLGMGLGLGQLLPQVEGMRYLGFVTLGLMLFSPANIAVLETMYGGFSRMAHQHTWEGIMDTAMSLDDIVLGEVIWAAMRGTTNALALWLMASLLGAFEQPLYVLPVILLSALVALMSSALGMILLGIARNFDGFTLFHTLVFVPATFLSGVFFPISQLPTFLQGIAYFFPFAPLIAAVRLAVQGHWQINLFAHGIGLAMVYLLLAFCLGFALVRKKLLA